MKRYLFTFWVLCLALTQSNAQDTLRTWFNEDWDPCEQSEATYFRDAYPDGDHWLVLDYYLDGTLQMSGHFLSQALETKTGKFIYYHQNGKVSEKGIYRDGEKSGIWEYWYESGIQSHLRVYSEFGEKHGEWQYWSADGTLLSTLHYDYNQLHGNATYWNEDGKMNMTGEYVGGKKDGEWKYWHKNGQLSSIEQNTNGKVASFEFWNEDGSRNKKAKVAFQMPTYPGGEEKLFKYLKKELSYPKIAQDANVSGTVYVRFIVKPDGTLTEHEIMRGIHPACDAEALRVVKNMKRWKPGILHNRKDDVSFNLPIKFILK